MSDCLRNVHILQTHARTSFRMSALILNSSCSAWQTARFLLLRDARLLQWKSLGGSVRCLTRIQDDELIVQLL